MVTYNIGHQSVCYNIVFCVFLHIAGLGTQNFYFQDRKKFEISGHFSGHQSHKITCFLSFPAHITSERLELRLK